MFPKSHVHIFIADNIFFSNISKNKHQYTFITQKKIVKVQSRGVCMFHSRRVWIRNVRQADRDTQEIDRDTEESREGNPANSEFPHLLFVCLMYPISKGGKKAKE